MYISDKPIQNEAADALGRSRFAKQLAKTLYEMNLEYSFFVGLYGEWRKGK